MKKPRKPRARKIDRKIGVDFKLNTNLKGVIENDKTLFPLYVEIRYLGQRSYIRSRSELMLSKDEYLELANADFPDLQGEKDLIIESIKVFQTEYPYFDISTWRNYYHIGYLTVEFACEFLLKKLLISWLPDGKIKRIRQMELENTIPPVYFKTFEDGWIKLAEEIEASIDILNTFFIINVLNPSLLPDEDSNLADAVTLLRSVKNRINAFNQPTDWLKLISVWDIKTDNISHEKLLYTFPDSKDRSCFLKLLPEIKKSLVEFLKEESNEPKKVLLNY